MNGNIKLKRDTLALLSLTAILALTACGSGSSATLNPTPSGTSISSVPAADRPGVKTHKNLTKNGMGQLVSELSVPGTLTLTEKGQPDKVVLAPKKDPADGNQEKLDLSQLPNGLLEYGFTQAQYTRGGKTTNIPDGVLKAYQMPYSISTRTFDTNGNDLGGVVQGLPTDPAKLPKNITASYRGAAFNAWTNNGVFNYTVTFGANLASTTGEGRISGLKGKPGNANYDWGTLTLAKLKGTNNVSWLNNQTGGKVAGFDGDWDSVTSNKPGAISTGFYTLGFYAPTGSELSGEGFVTIDKNDHAFGMGGKKQ